MKTLGKAHKSSKNSNKNKVFFFPSPSQSPNFFVIKADDVEKKKEEYLH